MNRSRNDHWRKLHRRQVARRRRIWRALIATYGPIIELQTFEVRRSLLLTGQARTRSLHSHGQAIDIRIMDNA